MALLLATEAARAACPAQPPSIDVSTGSGRACVRSTATAPVSRLEVRFTDVLGQPAVVTVLPTPPATVFADEASVTWTVPANVRGEGTVIGASVGPGGEATTSVAATFRPFDRPVSGPVLQGP